MTADAKSQATDNTKTARARSRSRAKLARRALWSAVALAVVAAIAVASWPKPILVEMAGVEKGSMTVTIDEVGKTRVRDRYVVSAPLSGNLARIELHPGDVIEPGQVLARLAPLDAPLLDARSRAQAQARVMQAEAARRQAQAAIARATIARDDAVRDAEKSQKLAKSGAVSAVANEDMVMRKQLRDAELASAKFAGQMADYEAQQARAVLARLSPGGGSDRVEVRAPIAGKVLRVIAESADVVQPGTPLLEIGDPGALEIVTEVLTADAVSIPHNAPATIERWGGAPLSANVRVVEPSAFSRMSALGVEEQRVHVVLDIRDPREQWKALGDGFRVEVKIVTWNGSDVVHVPSSAVFRREGSWATYVVADGKAQLRPVKVGKRNGSVVQVLEGLAPGEQVIVHPSDRVVAGARVAGR